MPKRRKKYKAHLKSKAAEVLGPASPSVHPKTLEPELPINIAAELRKIGLLSGIILLILLVLFFFLR